MKQNIANAKPSGSFPQGHRVRKSHQLGRKKGRRLMRLVFVFVVALSIYVFGFRGPTDVHRYPPSSNSPYSLPFQTGTSRWCAQGNRSTCSHRGRFKYSYDFFMPVGTPVVATRSGKVVEVNVARNSIGNFAGNRIVIEHSDGSRGFYVHLKKGGSAVGLGDTVKQGQVIGNSGTTGRSLFPHIHFHVEKDGEGIPFTFAGIGRHHGIPRTGFKYESR